MRLLGLVAFAFLAAAFLPPKNAGAGPTRVTNVFVGVASSGPGGSLPVDLNANDRSVRADGAIGLGYTYLASGHASGGLPGSFTYTERGYLFFTDPADAGTYAGSALASALFALRPYGTDRTIRIVDRNPAAYRYAIVTTPAGDLPAAARALLGRFLMLPSRGPVTYGTFTFTGDYGTFTGYATPDFRRFAIAIAFDPEGEALRYCPPPAVSPAGFLAQPAD